jgi:hypothetical protein
VVLPGLPTNQVLNQQGIMVAAAGIKGRGEYVRLCFEEAGVAYEDAGVKHGEHLGSVVWGGEELWSMLHATQ